MKYNFNIIELPLIPIFPYPFPATGVSSARTGGASSGVRAGEEGLGGAQRSDPGRVEATQPGGQQQRVCIPGR